MTRADGRTRRGEETRRRILDTTRILLAEVGNDLTLDEIAARLGLTRQAVLYHYPSKERVMVELALEALAVESDRAVAAVEDVVGIEALERFVRALVDFYVADVDAFRLIYVRGQVLADHVHWFPLEERAARLHPLTTRMYDAVEAALLRGDGLPEGVSARALVVSAHMAAVGFGTMNGVTAATGDPMKEGVGAYLDALLATLRR